MGLPAEEHSLKQLAEFLKVLSIPSTIRLHDTKERRSS